MARAALGTAFEHLRYIFGAGSVAGLGDRELLVRYSGSNDEVAFEALVNRHGPMVLATCRAVLRNEHDVEDAFQATFLVLAKKAGSIRGGDALGGWLHRVAYRASVQASVDTVRRRRKEAELSALAPANGSRPGPETDHEWKPILHEEIGRLPEGQRLPVVLCDLEGLTYEQAAEQLGWTVPTLRCRLAKARQRLGGRLTRRGVTALAVGTLLAPRGASAATAPATVSAALVRATVGAVMSGSASGSALLLAHTLLRGMLMTKIKLVSTAALLAVLALTAVNVIAVGGGPPQPSSEPNPKPKPPAQTAKEEPTGRKPAETVEVRGIIVAPDGHPVAGAAVRGAFFDRKAATPQATSGPDGQFTIRLPKPDWRWAGYMASYPWIFASAPGFGIGWTKGVLRADRPAEQVVKLIPEGPPIEGRVIDLEGRPVAAARIKLSRILFDEKGDLTGWIARARNGAEGNLWQGLSDLTLDKLLAIETVTGPDGRFKLTGVGRDRIADLLITGPGIATTPVHVLSRAEPELRMADRMGMTPVPLIVHAPRFQVALSPTRRVEGIARDKDSDSPIAGLEIRAAVFDKHSLIQAEGIEATTNAEGRYQLEGLPKAAAYRLIIKPSKGLPYLITTLKAPADSPAFEPVAFDFRLKRGIFVRGKVTDKVSGRPVAGYANYYPFADNPHLRDYAGVSPSHEQVAYFDSEGRYELVALPGRGLIAVRDEENRYLPATGYEGIKGYDPQSQAFRATRFLPARSYTVIAELDLAPNAGDTTRDLQADPGRSVAVEVVGPDGQPVGGTQVKGMTEMFATAPYPQDSARFEVHALDGKRLRRMVVAHESRKLIGSVLLKGDESGSIVIKLQPWGILTGRIVDDEGRPRKAMFITSPNGSENPHPETDDILPGSDWNSGIRVGDDGRFLVEGLVPGVQYSAVSRTGFEAFGDLFKNIIVAPGEAMDLGDLKVQPPKKQED
ncbi:RNA polymerase sigma factor, sigma-70 family [Singulisphaera sp. GP187]|uniref:sigma-70 family RNA polymerase sigma factor n=1 Tax=Singulisphaera sp. GP187 TaxID=1882752 RepID=UPI000926E13D|nr:sigma-70 family RNA polymerase sigma factor [Singulisphaera sp. GP187]SIN80112.1 RNA polymerase sigma factor, sigma-70 family [Singulisphaera sp. GP187]